MEQYLKQLKYVMEEGVVKKPSRSNMPSTKSIFGYQKRYNLSEGFPMLTTKKVFWKGIVVELLWFLNGETNVKYLVDQGVMFWCEDAYNYYKKIALKYEFDSEVNSIYCPISLTKNVRNPENGQDVDSYSLFTFEEFVNIVKNVEYEKLPKYGKYVLGDCGMQYGKLWRNLKGLNGDDEIIVVDQFKNLLKSLTSNPESRRHIITAWNPFTLDDMALPACHSFVQFYTRELSIEEREELVVKHKDYHPANRWVFWQFNDERAISFLNDYNIPKYKLDCQLYQRSGDIFLGTNMNTSSYSLLMYIISKLTNMVVGEFVHTFGDVHLYDNLVEQASEQLTRDPKKYPLPTLVLSDKFNDDKLPKNFDTDLDTWIKSLEFSDFKLDNYQSYPTIKGQLSTGM